jgi:sporulation protein YlmC with PRC-barrel domain
MSFYQVREADLRASDLIGLDVYNTNNESIGEIDDLILDDGDTIRAIVLDVGGFLGIGERRVAVTPASIVIEKRGDELDRAIVNATKESLQNAPEFKRQAQAR